MEPIILVKLKMRKIYKFFLTVFSLLIMLMASIGVLYLVDGKGKLFDSDIEVNGTLSINYVDGKKFEIENSKTIKFTVTNASDNVSYYNISFNQIRGNGTYKIFYDNTLVMEGSLTTIDEVTTDYISIDSKETKNYTLELNNTGDTPLKGYLNIYNQSGKMNTFSDIILKNSPASEQNLTKVGMELAVEDEGLIKSSDDIGVSYYFRGNVENNYVSFSNKLWRIVRINGDGTVRLVLDNAADTLASFYTDENKFQDYEKTNMNTFLENWLEQNIRENIKYVANTKFCYDNNKDTDGNYLASTRIMTNKLPTLNCLGTSVNNNIGLLTIDEVILAGASSNGVNQKYYLYNPDIKNSWFTMSAAKGDDNNLNLFMITQSGGLDLNVSGGLYRNVRPVINLIKNIEMTGDGTKDNPYIIAG